MRAAETLWINILAIPEPKPRGTVHRCFRASARVRHNAGMAHAPNFKLALTRVIVPTAGPGVELATLADAARVVAMLRPFRQARPH